MIVEGGLKCQDRVVSQIVSLFEGQASNRAECRERTIIRPFHPQEVAPNGLGSQRTFALWWTRFRRWLGLRVPMVRLNSSTGAGWNTPACLRKRRRIGAGRLRFIPRIGGG